MNRVDVLLKHFKRLFAMESELALNEQVIKTALKRCDQVAKTIEELRAQLERLLGPDDPASSS